MGMAASQARFLTLTARKSNVEYEGQQVNQERTSLANESSGLFNKMMALQVPTPPSATDFYNTRYTFEATGMDYSITSTTPRTDGRYDMTIAYKTTENTAKAYSVFGSMNFASGVPSSIDVRDKNCPIIVLTRNADGDYVDSTGKIDTNVKTIAKIAGEDLTSEDNAVFYKYRYGDSDKDTTYYISGTNMAALIKGANGASSYDISNTFSNGLSAFYITDQTVTKTLTAVGGFPETTSEGRFEELRVDEITSEGVDENVKKDMTSVLAHEMAHLFFDKFVYQKFGVSRVRWLDESFACRFENPYQKTAKIKVLEMCEYISKKYPNFNMDRLSAGIPNEFNHNDAYSMFRIIAIYIEKNGKERDWISVFDKGQGKVKKLSKTILNDAIHDIKRN